MSEQKDITRRLRRWRGTTRSALAQSSAYGKAPRNRVKLEMLDEAIAEITRLRALVDVQGAEIAMLTPTDEEVTLFDEEVTLFDDPPAPAPTCVAAAWKDLPP